MYQRTTATKKIRQLRKRIRGIQGGSSASKTISVLMWLIAFAQADKKSTLTSVVSESLPHLKRGAIKDFLSIMQTHGYYKDDQWNRSDFVYTFETGSKIEFFSVDQPDKVRGPRRDRLFINEANNVPYETFDQLEIRTKEFIYLDWNPTNEFWFYSVVCHCGQTHCVGDRTDVDHIILTYKDNEALDINIVNSLEQRKLRTSWWKVYGEGHLGEVDGKIYKGWATIDEIPHEAKLVRYCLDFGYSNDPSALLAIYEYNGGYILHELLFQKGLSNKQIADTINAQPERALVVADSAEPKSIDEIKGYGVNIVGATKGKDSVTNGIQVVQDMRISVTRASSNVLNEYRNYLWETDPRTSAILNIPEHTFSHSMDAARYGLVSLSRPVNQAPTIHYPTAGTVSSSYRSPNSFLSRLRNIGHS